jgi:hypothetical protein
MFNQILDYNDGRRVLHKVGRFINDRYTHRNRWVRAMRQTTVPMRLIDGPVDPNSGAHMAEDVPSSVELRWRPGEHQAALTSSLCMTGPTDLAVSRSRAARSVGRCR